MEKKKEEVFDDDATFSEDLEDLLGRAPSRMFRFGIIVIVSIVIVILIGANIIKYPKVISGEIVIYNRDIPVKIVQPRDGYIKHILVKDGSEVDSNGRIAVLSDFTNYSNLLFLKELVENDVFANIKTILQADDASKAFGEIQPEYNALIANIMEYSSLYDSYQNKALDALQEKAKGNDSILRNSSEQLQLSKEMLTYEQGKSKDYKYLYENGVITKHEYLAEIGQLVNREYLFEDVKRNMTSQRMNIKTGQAQHIEFVHDLTIKRTTLSHKIIANIRNIKNFISQWEQRNLLKSPKKGRVIYISQLAEGQFFKYGEPLVAVTSKKTGLQGIVSILATTEGLGNIQAGQRVRIKIAKYPHLDFNYVYGNVNSFTTIANNDKYFVQVSNLHSKNVELNQKLYNEEELKGTADIITRDYTVLQRIFLNLKKVLDSKNKSTVAVKSSVQQKD